MGKIAIVVVVVMGITVPALLSAAPGNPAGELGREEIKFQGMYDQLCAMSTGDGKYNAAMDAINVRRRAAYQRRGKPAPRDYQCDAAGGPK